MKDLWNYLKESNRPIVLYGMGDGAEKIIFALTQYSLKISGVFASDGFVRKKSFKGFPVTDYKTAKANFPDMTVLVSFGTPLKSVIENIKNIAKETELFVPDVPVYGGELFNAEFYENHIDEIEKVSSFLADTQSKICFENIIKFKLSGDMNYLFSCETDGNEPFETFFKSGENETFFDLGAYRGDTVLSFAETHKNYNKIVAVEPDKKTFLKLENNTANIENITLFNAAVSEKCGQKKFLSRFSRGSFSPAKNTTQMIGESHSFKSQITDCITVDYLSEKFIPTYIKFDVEGSEIAAIKGAFKTIGLHKPKMKIAAYHRSEDLFKIPLLVKSINPDYKVYLRHNPCLPAWDTDFYFV